MMMSIAQRNAETVKQNQSEARMNVDMKDINVTVVPPDMLILVSMNKLRQMENELKAAREVVKYLRDFDATHLMGAQCPCGCDTFKQTLKKYDEARQK